MAVTMAHTHKDKRPATPQEYLDALALAYLACPREHERALERMMARTARTWHLGEDAVTATLERACEGSSLLSIDA